MEALSCARRLYAEGSMSRNRRVFVRCREESKYQQRLASLLAAYRRQNTVPTLESVDWLCLAGYLRRLYLATNVSYLAKEFQFEARVPDMRGGFAWTQKLELFSVQISDLAKY